MPPVVEKKPVEKVEVKQVEKENKKVEVKPPEKPSVVVEAAKKPEEKVEVKAPIKQAEDKPKPIEDTKKKPEAIEVKPAVTAIPAAKTEPKIENKDQKPALNTPLMVTPKVETVNKSSVKKEDNKSESPATTSNTATSQVKASTEKPPVEVVKPLGTKPPVQAAKPEEIKKEKPPVKVEKPIATEQTMQAVKPEEIKKEAQVQQVSVDDALNKLLSVPRTATIYLTVIENTVRESSARLGPEEKKFTFPKTADLSSDSSESNKKVESTPTPALKASPMKNKTQPADKKPLLKSNPFVAANSELLETVGQKNPLNKSLSKEFSEKKTQSIEERLKLNAKNTVNPKELIANKNKKNGKSKKFKYDDDDELEESSAEFNEPKESVIM